MSLDLVNVLKTWNPWWEKGKDGINDFKDPQYKRELYPGVFKQLMQGEQIVSLVGMRQVGKSTIMRQIIKDLLYQGVNPKSIFYLSFDDPFLATQYVESEVFDKVLQTYSEQIINSDLREYAGEIYLFLDEIHKLPKWENYLKKYYDQSYPIKYLVSGSSSIHLQKTNRESLLGRIFEFVLWPFSFREFAAYNFQENFEFQEAVQALQTLSLKFVSDFKISGIEGEMKDIFKKLNTWKKKDIIDLLKKYIVIGGFPRVWQLPDFASRQKFIWDQYVGKVIFEDLMQAANFRRPKDLEFIFSRLIEFNGKETQISDLKQDIGISRATLDKYLEYLGKIFLIFKVEKTKSKRTALKKKSGNIKFYLTDVSLRNAFYKRDENVFYNDDEMGLIAENLVRTKIQSWIDGPQKEEQIGFFRDGSGEIDFIVKNLGFIMPIEVKWRSSPALKTLDKIAAKWNLKESMVITKDFDLTFKNGRLSIPLWFFLLGF